MKIQILLKSSSIITIWALFVSITPNLCLSQNYATVAIDSSAIFVGPTTDAEVVTKAYQGDILEIISQNSEWIEITLFSEEYRYISTSAIKKTESMPPYPDSTVLKQNVCQEIVESEDKAMRNSSSEYPNDIMEQINFERILIDRYKLKIFRENNISAPYHSKLLIECVEHGWY